jgi:hypothetical protein
MDTAMTSTSPTTLVLDEVVIWPGVSTQPTPRGATAILLGDRELGHIHADRGTLDLPLPDDRRKQALAAGRATRWFPNWVSKPLRSYADVRDGIALLRDSYDELRPLEHESSHPKGVSA